LREEGTMFSVPDIMVLSVLGLLLFGPDRLPGIMRQAGRIMREVQNTSQSFISEMERSAEIGTVLDPMPSAPEPKAAESHAAEPPAPEPKVAESHAAEPSAPKPKAAESHAAEPHVPEARD
jgi:Sec-independent protein translocase protein TatA